MIFNKLLTPCRIVPVVHRVILTLNKANPKYIVKRGFLLDATYTRIMAQRSITSFFKVSPPKNAVVKDEKEQEITTESTKSDDKLHADNVIEKMAYKRVRLESSGSEAEVSTTINTLQMKKKTKRQRIESSGSESETCKSDEQQSPEEQKVTIKVETSDSPVKASPVKNETAFNVEKSKKVKTYQSPKSKKKTSNALSEPNKQASEKKKDSNTTSSVKKESSKKTVENKDLLKRSPSPNNDSKMKLEVSNGDVESPEKNKENVKEKLQEADNKEVVEIVSESDYNPAKSNYHPIKDACWSAKQPVPYLALTQTLEIIEGTSARLKIIEILANYFRSVIALTPEDLLPSIYMCLNQLAPAYHSLELGIAETYLMKAVGACTGQSVAQLRTAARAAGDLGAAAAAARRTQRTLRAAPALALRAVLHALRDIARTTGQASVNKKINKIQTLFVACRQSEAKFLIRSLEGKLRIGLAEQSVLAALARAAALTPPDPAGVGVLDASKGLPPDVFKSRVEEQALIIKTTYCECPNYEVLVAALLQHGVAALPQHCRLTVGIPLKPMLAHPTRGVHEVFNRFEGCAFTCEWKYDGERAQIHVPSGAGGGAGGGADVRGAAVYSRSQEDTTSKYPDIISRLPSLLKESVSSCILDCEAVAYDTETKQILPFQVLSTRKRKAARAADVAVQVCVFVFDVLLLNGEPLVRRALPERRALLAAHFNAVEGVWQFARSRDCSSAEEVQQFMEEAVRGSCEGLMLKALTGDAAYYDIARRSHNWLKLKKDYLEGAGDSIDVVIIGAYWGRGKRRRTYGGFLAAARDPDADCYQSLCKLGTGFSDDDLQTLTADLGRHVIDAPRNYYSYDASHAAEVWFAAACVWEVRCADLSLSPAHRAAAGLVDPDKGISLRFPRFVRARPDKAPEQATSAQQIARMYLAQDQVRARAARSKPALDDFY